MACLHFYPLALRQYRATFHCTCTLHLDEDFFDYLGSSVFHQALKVLFLVWWKAISVFQQDFTFDSMHIFMLLIIPIHEYGMPFISSPDDVLFPSFNYVWDFYLAISFPGCGFSYLPLMPHSCLHQQRMYSLLSTRPGAFGNSMGLEPVPLHS